MKPMLRFSIAVVTVGICFLMFCGQTRNDVVAAQGGKPVMMYRFYTGKDGLSHVEKIEEMNFDQNNVANLMETTTGAMLRRSKPDAPGADFGAFHPGPRRQYIFDLAGHEEVEFSGGEGITLNPGDIELIEDLAPTKGHRNRGAAIRQLDEWATAHRSRLFRNRITHHRLIGDRYPQHQTVLRSEVAVPVAFGRGEVLNELYVSGI